MRNSTILLLPAILLALFGITSVVQADEPRPENEKLLALSDQDDELTRLLTQRRNELLEAYRDMSPLYRAGRISPTDFQSAAIRFARANLDVATDEAGRVRVLETAHRELQTIERIVRAKFDGGNEPIQAVCRATGLRLNAEIELLRAKAEGLSEAEKATSARLGKLLDERRTAVGQEVAAQLVLYRGGRATLESTCDAIERQAVADVESVSAPDERVKRLQSAVDTAKSIEAIVEGKFGGGVESNHALARARFLRLDLEIALARARQTPADNAELLKARQARRDAAKEEVEALRGLYGGGRAALDEVAAAVARHTRAALDLAATPAERVNALTVPYDTSVELEKIVREKFENGNEPSQAMHRATAARLTAEIDLLRARRAAE